MTDTKIPLNPPLGKGEERKLDTGRYDNGGVQTELIR